MIHGLPGMGADHRMYLAPWKRIPGWVAHDWVPYRGQTRLSEIALEMCDRCDIRDGDDLVGTSLGGMVACEMTRFRNIRHLYLVASALERKEIHRLLGIIHPLARWMPFATAQKIARKLPDELARMFGRADPEFIRATCVAIFSWEGIAPTTTVVRRIHGRRDSVIPQPRSVDHWIDGGHLISITHAAECANFVMQDTHHTPVDGRPRSRNHSDTSTRVRP